MYVNASLQVEQIQSEYVSTLRTYVNHQRSEPGVVLGSLLGLLVVAGLLQPGQQRHLLPCLCEPPQKCPSLSEAPLY